jgi:hypothetical protein
MNAAVAHEILSPSPSQLLLLLLLLFLTMKLFIT